MNRSEQVAGLGMSVGRMEAFSDGVLAIVITLLILDVKVPAEARLVDHRADLPGRQGAGRRRR